MSKTLFRILPKSATFVTWECKMCSYRSRLSSIMLSSRFLASVNKSYLSKSIFVDDWRRGCILLKLKRDVHRPESLSEDAEFE